MSVQPESILITTQSHDLIYYDWKTSEFNVKSLQQKAYSS